MTLPNAHSGVKKLFIAEILQIIGAVLICYTLVALGGMIAAVGAGSQSAAEGFAMSSIISLIGGAICPIVDLVLILVGLKQASKDEPDRMDKAFKCGIASLIFAVIAGILQAAGWGGAAFFSFIGSVLELCMMIFAIMGVSEVTQNISRQDVADMGPKILTFVAIAYGIAIIARIIGNVIGGYAAIVAAVLMIIAYFIFLVFLGRATSALAKG